jgi:serine/threonine protein kinase
MAIRTLIEGFDFLHSKLLLHRDLKPENILLDDNNYLKIADFGLAKKGNLHPRKNSNTIQSSWYRAPEVHFGAEQYSIEIDMWSIGCIALELFTL